MFKPPRLWHFVQQLEQTDPQDSGPGLIWSSDPRRERTNLPAWEEEKAPYRPCTDTI